MKKRTAIDLGASQIRVLAPGSDEIAICPTVVALECVSGRPVSFGIEAQMTAKRMPGSVDLIHPLLESEAVTSTVLEGLFACAASLVSPSGRFKTDLVLAIPASISETQESAYPDAASAVGAKDVYVVSGLYAAAQSIEHATTGPTALIHMGASSCEMGIFSGGECIVSRIVPIGGRALDDLLGDSIYDRYGLLLDSDGAEKLKNRLSELSGEEKTISVGGIHRRTGLPRVMTLETEALVEVLMPAYRYLTDPLLEMVGIAGECPAKVALTGGCAAVCGIADAIRAVLPESEVAAEPDPSRAVIRGLDRIIQQKQLC